ncbi:hypothetical protein MIR68_003418 [Amoeboaphelidium protococcarum]|nr:hypothetical protein MIR68_003418 [Amoeboaphelidium protococcarum]
MKSLHILVTNISQLVKEKDLYDVFKHCGRVVLMKPCIVSGLGKSAVFIYQDTSDAVCALYLDGVVIGDLPVVVKPLLNYPPHQQMEFIMDNFPVDDVVNNISLVMDQCLDVSLQSQQILTQSDAQELLRMFLGISEHVMVEDQRSSDAKVAQDDFKGRQIIVHFDAFDNAWQLLQKPLIEINGNKLKSSISSQSARQLKEKQLRSKLLQSKRTSIDQQYDSSSMQQRRRSRSPTSNIGGFRRDYDQDLNSQYRDQRGISSQSQSLYYNRGAQEDQAHQRYQQTKRQRK